MTLFYTCNLYRENFFVTYIHISTLVFNYTQMKMTHLSHLPNMNSIREVGDSFGTTSLTSQVKCHVSLCLFLLIFLYFFMLNFLCWKVGETSQWRVCFSTGLPRLVLTLNRNFMQYDQNRQNCNFFVKKYIRYCSDWARCQSVTISAGSIL